MVIKSEAEKRNRNVSEADLAQKAKEDKTRHVQNHELFLHDAGPAFKYGDFRKSKSKPQSGLEATESDSVRAHQRQQKHSICQSSCIQPKKQTNSRFPLYLQFSARRLAL
jgi:hypothetical protein